MNIYRFRLIAALTAALLIGRFGWHWAYATDSNEAARALTEVASANTRSSILELEAMGEQAIRWAVIEKVRLLGIDHLLAENESGMSRGIDAMRRHGVIYSGQIRRSLARLQQANAALHDKLVEVESCAYLLRKSGTSSNFWRMNESRKAYIVLMGTCHRALVNLNQEWMVFGDHLEAISDALGSSGPRTYINRYVQDKPQAISDAAGK